MHQYIEKYEELAADMLEEIHQELVDIIRHPGPLKLNPGTLRRVHRNLFTYSHRRIILSEELLDRVHQDSLSRLTEEETSLLAAYNAQNRASNAQEESANGNVLPETQTRVRSNSTQAIRALLAEGHPVKEVAKQLGIRYQTVYQIAKKMR